MNSETVRPATPGQIKDIMATLVGAVPNRLTYQQAQMVIAKKSKLVVNIHKVFKEFSEQEQNFPGAWKVLEIGGGSKQDLLDQLKSVPVKIWATKMVERENCTILSERKKIALVLRTVEQLGFTEQPYERRPEYDDVVAQGLKLGLKLCPPEVGPRLWLAQEELGMENGYYQVAMDKLLTLDDVPAIFGLAVCNQHEQKNFHHWLNTGDGLRAKQELKKKFIFCQ